MKRILITGMSGTGKSAVIVELMRRGYRAIDLDTPEWSHWIDAAPDDDLTPRDGRIGSGGRTAFGSYFREMTLTISLSAAAPRTWVSCLM